LISTNNTTTYIVSSTGNATLTTTANSGSFTATTATPSANNYVVTSKWGTDADKAWIMEIPITGGFTGGAITLSFKAHGSPTGPRDFAVEWSTNGTSWSTATATEQYTLTGSSADKTITITPSGLTTKLYIRLRNTSGISVRAGTGSYTVSDPIQTAGTSRITGKLTIEQE
jgi:hypothetical protein